MSQLVETIAAILALGAALLAAALGALQDLPIPLLAARAVIAGLVVFLFVRLGGDLALRTILRSLAEDELNRESARNTKESTKSGSEDRKAA